MKIIGLDLSGPTNLRDTVLVCFEEVQGGLSLRRVLPCASDLEVFNTVSVLPASKEIVIGLDAPLSYNDGGGDRSGDKALRKLVVEAGMLSGSVMTPTMTRMAYLTLRGIALTRMLETLRPARELRIVEVHPGAAMALRGAPLDAVRRMKLDADARQTLLRWLEEQGLTGVASMKSPTDHYVAACAAALAAWKWRNNEAVWRMPAAPPLHPYEYAC